MRDKEYVTHAVENLFFMMLHNKRCGNSRICLCDVDPNPNGVSDTERYRFESQMEIVDIQYYGTVSETCITNRNRD